MDLEEHPRVAASGIALLLQPVRSRGVARDLAVVGDTEAFRRPLGGYFRDRFAQIAPRPERLRVLFVSPYPIVPPIHGGGVFMYQTVRELARLCELHLIVLLHYPDEGPPHRCLSEMCASDELLAKPNSRPST